MTKDDNSYRARLELESVDELELDLEDHSDKRLTRRCDIEIPGFVTCNGKTLPITTKDISLKSVGIKEKLPPDFRGKVVVLMLKYEHQTVEIKCTLPMKMNESQVLLFRQTKDIDQLRAWMLVF